MKTRNFETKQKGYGRQGLYFVFDGELYHLCDVSPNIEEQFNICHEDYCSENENGVVVDENNNAVTPYSDINQWLFDHFKEEIGDALYKALWNEENWNEDYNLNFENSTNEQIAEWALNY